MTDDQQAFRARVLAAAKHLPEAESYALAEAATRYTSEADMPAGVRAVLHQAEALAAAKQGRRHTQDTDTG